MRKFKLRPWQGAVLALACLASGAWADDTLTIVNAGAYAAMGGVYTSPYGITVSPSTTPTLMICDDFETDISLGYSWTGDMSTLTQIDSSDVAGLKFGSSPYSSAILGGAANTAEDYATAAVLAAELLELPNVGTSGEDTEAAGELSYAIWSVFDSSLYNMLTSTGNTGYGALTATEVSAVQGYINAAQLQVAGATVGGVTNLNDISVNGSSIAALNVYTPNPLNASQEFLQVSMPEPSYPAVLAADVLLAGLVIAFLRRRVKATS